ncbi:MAG: HlyD family secretion protein, partial [Bacteroidales bacterium]|nr:HlyD family secretion protein [Bacteroidales bacterium]
ELNISKKLSDSLLSISNENYRSDSILFSNKSISPLEFRQSQSQMIKLKQEQQDVNVSIATAQLEFNAIEEQLIEAKNMRIEKDKALSLELNNAMERLKGEIYVWKEKNTLVSPIAGRVTYSRIWGENQFVNQDQTVCNVVPEATSKVIGKINVPVQNSGKVKTGQRVNLKFNNFPHKEFGFIETNLEQISLIPDSFYVATVVLPDTLLTNYGLVIPFSQNMQGRAEIITENRSLFLRIISPIKSVLKERM